MCSRGFTRRLVTLITSSTNAVYISSQFWKGHTWSDVNENFRESTWPEIMQVGDYYIYIEFFCVHDLRVLLQCSLLFIVNEPNCLVVPPLSMSGPPAQVLKHKYILRSINPISIILDRSINNRDTTIFPIHEWTVEKGYPITFVVFPLAVQHGWRLHVQSVWR